MTAVASGTVPDQHVGSAGYVGGTIENGLSDQQVLHRESASEEVAGQQNDSRSVQSGAGRSQRSGSARTAVHLLADRLQRSLRRTRSDFAG